jgi:hypothetical protein
VLAAEGLPWLDGRAWLFGTAAERLPVIAGDQHFTAEGNRRAAERVAAWLVETAEGSALLDGAVGR